MAASNCGRLLCLLVPCQETPPQHGDPLDEAEAGDRNLAMPAKTPGESANREAAIIAPPRHQDPERDAAHPGDRETDQRPEQGLP